MTVRSKGGLAYECGKDQNEQAQERLDRIVTQMQKELFSRYTDCMREYQAMAEYLLFQKNFL